MSIINESAIWRSAVQALYQRKTAISRNAFCHYELINQLSEFDFHTKGQVVKQLAHKSCSLRPSYDDQNPHDLRYIEAYASQVADMYKDAVEEAIANELSFLPHSVTLPSAQGREILHTIAKQAKDFFGANETPDEYQRIIVGPALLTQLRHCDDAFVQIGWGSFSDLPWFINKSVGYEDGKILAYAIDQTAVGVAHTEIAEEMEISDMDDTKRHLIYSAFRLGAAVIDESQVLKIKI